MSLGGRKNTETSSHIFTYLHISSHIFTYLHIEKLLYIYIYTTGHRTSRRPGATRTPWDRPRLELLRSGALGEVSGVSGKSLQLERKEPAEVSSSSGLDPVHCCESVKNEVWRFGLGW